MTTHHQAARDRAAAANRSHLKKIEKRANESGAVLGPCVQDYLLQTKKVEDPIDLIHNLTGPLLSAFPTTRALIEEKMKARWVKNPERVPMSVVNSLRRSAGTNYQGLVSYALARYLIETASTWYLQHPLPAQFKESLAIRFTAGLSHSEQVQEHAAGPGEGGSHLSRLGPEKTEPGETLIAEALGLAEEDFDETAVVEGKEPEEALETEVEGAFLVSPDVDILLRNAGWDPSSSHPEPVILLSIKTSLADRAGAAARWKTYFDLATNPCPHRAVSGCVYTRLGISMDNAEKYSILHGIVTANIYKFQFHDVRYRKGELASGQVRSNTYMFDLKLTTRNDGIAETPSDWQQFPAIAEVLGSYGRG